jgi:hypothetical protein
VGGAALTLLMALRGGGQPAARAGDEFDLPECNTILRGLQTSPILLHLKRRNRALVGLGIDRDHSLPPAPYLRAIPSVP